MSESMKKQCITVCNQTEAVGAAFREIENWKHAAEAELQTLVEQVSALEKMVEDEKRDVQTKVAEVDGNETREIVDILNIFRLIKDDSAKRRALACVVAYLG